MQNLVVDTIAANKVKVSQGFEMKDQATGETYCVTILAGQWSQVQESAVRAARSSP